MSFLRSLFGRRGGGTPAVPPAAAAVAGWVALPPSDLRVPLSSQRWLVVDVETTGLNMRQDRLLAIGAVVVDGRDICFDQSFEVVIRQAAASNTDNILIHRIAGSEQLQGVDAAEALAAFLAFAGKLPCVAFHASFDEAMLRRAVQENLGIEFDIPFIDLAHLAPALIREAPPKLNSLDDWVGHFSIEITSRHRAVADAVGTAQLLQVLLWRAAAQAIPSADALFKMAREQRWLAGLGRR